MARIEISGIGIEYELIGPAGAPVFALTPGGRMSKDAPGVRELGQALVAHGRRVLLWDRPNCGASDLCFEGASESGMQGRTLTALIRALGLGPIAIGGGSAGSRTTLLAAAHDPEAVSHLVQWWISGGTLSLLQLGAAYYGEAAYAASLGGMAAVAALPTWAEQVARNPRSRDVLLGQDVDAFIAKMEHWAQAFVPSETSPVPGMARADFDRLTMPVLIFRGSARDVFHPARIADEVHRLLPQSELVETPWSDAEFAALTAEATRTGRGHLADWPRLAPAIDAFISR